MCVCVYIYIHIYIYIYIYTGRIPLENREAKMVCSETSERNRVTTG